MLVCRVMLGLVVSLGLIAVAPVVIGMTSTVVMSDSMSPGIHAGDVVAVRPSAARDVQVGQVVLVDDPNMPGRLRLHRLVGHVGARLVLKGDANAQPDPASIAPGAVHGMAFLRVPWIGLPVLWLRTGQPGPVAIAVAGLVAAAALVAVLDPGKGVVGGPVVRLLRATPMRRIGRRAARESTAGAAVVLALLLVGATPLTGTSTTSWAAFSGTTTSKTNTLSVPVWPCPTLPSAGSAGTPGIAYSFNPLSGSEPNRGSASGFSAAVGADAVRVGGSCTSGATPSLRFPGTGSQAVVSATSIPSNSPGTQTMWFNPTTSAGVLESVGSGLNATNTDRQLYFTTSGALSFAMHNGSAGLMTCSIASNVSSGVWHFVAVSYDTGLKTVTAYLDGATIPCSTSITSPSALSVPTRIGADITIDPNASTSLFRGSIDEAYAWGPTVLTAAQVELVRANGH